MISNRDWILLVLRFLFVLIEIYRLFRVDETKLSNIVKYISIDGDDVGRKITACYISNDEKKLQEISKSLEVTTLNISNLLISLGFKVLFCAADGIAASIEKPINFTSLFENIRSLTPAWISYSAGVGQNLREAFVALQAAKCDGKNRLYEYSQLAGNQPNNIKDV